MIVQGGVGMDKVIIFGGYEFLGFSLCEAFLEKGIQVCTMNTQQVDDLFLENKRLLVGRNSNFTECSLEKSLDTWSYANEKLLIVLSFYDFYLKGESSNIHSELDQVILDALKTCETGDLEVLFLLPVQFLEREESTLKGEGLKNIYNTMCQELQSSFIPNTTIYLPTLYGPWQSEDYLFHHALLEEVRGQNEVELQVNDHEYTEDALFVEDAIIEIVKIVEGQKNTICRFTSTSQNQWRKCAEFLDISTEKYMRSNKTIKPIIDIAKYEVRESIGYVQALTKQKKHLQRILEEF